MRVLLVNTSERIGGAAIAANRLMEALKNNGIKAKMLVRDKQTNHITVVALDPSIRHQVQFVCRRRSKPLRKAWLGAGHYGIPYIP